MLGKRDVSLATPIAQHDKFFTYLPKKAKLDIQPTRQIQRKSAIVKSYSFRSGSVLPCFMPKTYIFHLKRNPEIKVPIALITVDDCKKMIGKSYYLIHKDYEPSGKPFRVVVDSVYPEDDCEIMTICVCHRADGKKRGERIEVGFECLFKSRLDLWLDKLEENRFAKKMKKLEKQKVPCDTVLV